MLQSFQDDLLKAGFTKTAEGMWRSTPFSLHFTQEQSEDEEEEEEVQAKKPRNNHTTVFWYDE